MKRVVTVVFLTSTVLNAHALPPVIYGDDGRKEVFEASILQQELARSTPSLVPVDQIKALKEDGTVDLVQTTLEEFFSVQGGEKALLSPITGPNQNFGLKLCSGERFINQPVPAMCSGFLIAPDLVATAGHCAELFKMCANYKWIFDYKVDESTGVAGIGIKAENIYSCKRIITKSLNTELQTDYAIIQLDRKVTGRSPLEVRTSGLVAMNAPLFVIGNPSGLPLKVTEGAQVRDNVHPMFFKANLDTFQGNSGSAVFNAETNKVEGILVRGEEDFKFNKLNKCLESNKCKDDECRGEDVSSITSVPEIALQKYLDQAAESGDAQTLEVILSFNTWVDFYGKDGRSALMKAAAAGMNNTVKVLLDKGADVKLTDAEGNTVLHHLAPVLSSENMETLTTLLAAGAEFCSKNNEGQTPLMMAAKAGNTVGLEILLQAGALE